MPAFPYYENEQHCANLRKTIGDALEQLDGTVERLRAVRDQIGSESPLLDTPSNGDEVEHRNGKQRALP